eukprot:6275752-Amphidinium_carterae.1
MLTKLLDLGFPIGSMDCETCPLDVVDSTLCPSVFPQMDEFAGLDDAHQAITASDGKIPH